MVTYLDAFGRALSWWLQRGDGDLEDLLNRIVFEARQVAAGDVMELAVLLKRRDAPFLVARGDDATIVPVEALASLFVAHQSERGGCRVRDHALDTVRFIEGRFRTSIMVSVNFPGGLSPSAECAVWVGLRSAASAEIIAHTEDLAKRLGEWLGCYAGAIVAHAQAATQREESERRIAELQALLHDARAPLGVLRYLASEGGCADSRDTAARELEYLERILAQGAPRRASERSCDGELGPIISRVAQRFTHEVGVERIRVERGYERISTPLIGLDVERIVTNLVSNAFRHSPGCHVTISLEARLDRAIIIVSDTGMGIPNEVLDAIERDEELTERATSGWGLGLRSCKAKLQLNGGELAIRSEVGRGTVVEVSLPRVSNPVEGPTAFVAEAAVGPPTPVTGQVTIIDDDRDHSASLEKLLQRYGVSARQFGSVDSFVFELSEREGQIVLCDAHMPDGGAERLLTLLSERAHSARVAVMSGDVSDEYLYKVSALGAQAFFCKPVDLGEVCGWIREVQGMPIRAQARQR